MRVLFTMAMIGCLLAPLYCFSQRDTLRNNYYEQKEYQNQKQKPSFASRLMIGGNLGLAFGSVTYISVNPLVGYRVTNNFTAGIGINYQYWSEKYVDPYTNQSITFTSNIYGGSVFARYTVFRGLFLEGDFEANNLDAYNVDNPANVYSTRMWVPSLLLGGGYFSGGARGGFYISILYDVIQNIYSPYYGIPVIRAGVGFGL